MSAFRRLLQYSRPYWARIVVSLIASLGVAGTDGAIAYLVEPLLKKIFTEKDLTIFYLLPLGVIGVFIFRGVCRFCQEYYIRTAGQLAIQDIRNDLFEKNMALPLRFFAKNPIGVLMSRVLNDVGMMQEGVSSVITGVLKEGFAALGLLGVVFYRNWKLAIVALLVIPLTVLPAQKIGRRIKNVSKETQIRVGIIASILQETFFGIKVIKAFRLEERSIDKFFAVNRECYHFLRKAIKYGSISTPIMELITSFGIAGVIWFGGHQVIRGEMTATEFFSFVAAMIMLYGPIKKLLGSYNSVQQSLAAAERVFETMDERREIVDRPGARELAKAAGEVEFRQVSFRYEEDNVLKNINLTARRGEIIALVGQSGGGKSTLVSLIPRFYDVTEGAVLIDGIDIRDLKLDSLLRQIALVDQETILFNDSLANNIRYGKPDAGDAEVEAAARAAFAHDFIGAMPDGYATNIGDRGIRLSGGQRQRICIARAILKDAPILILDEATSALDTESEQMVQDALNNLIANRTTFVIAHRLSTVLNADRILVLDQGEIVESGTHGELLQVDGIYRKLYDMQFND